jgi:hypothetical protein
MAITEQEWLACSDPQPMLNFLRGNKNRKVRLFGCACCRRIGHLLKDDVICQALHRAELYADGLIRDSTAMTWYKKAAAARDRLPKQRGPDDEVKWLAYHAVAEATISNRYAAYLNTYRTVAHAVVRFAGVPTGGAEWSAAFAMQQAALVPLLRDIAGDPFHPVSADRTWLTPTVTSLAEAAYQDRAFDRLPILADALEDAGCDNADILNHCRKPGEHVRGCWVVDLVLGRE